MDKKNNASGKNGQLQSDFCHFADPDLYIH